MLIILLTKKCADLYVKICKIEAFDVSLHTEIQGESLRKN